MNILMLNYEFPPLGGGAGNANYYILREFAKYPDLNIDLVTSSTGKYRCERFADNIIIHYLDINKKKENLHYQTNRDLVVYSCKAYRYARGLVKQKRYDLVHAFFGIPCGYLAMKLGLPYIVSLRGSDVPFYNRRFYWLDRLFFKRLSARIWQRAYKVVANSQGLKNLALAACPSQEIAVIHNGVDTDNFYPRAGERTKETLKIISVGRLIERKGYRYLIESLKGLDKVELLLIGEGNLKEQLEKMAGESRVHVNFLGKVSHDHLISYYQDADLFVLPSLNEGMSNAVLEAMACGLPVIVTDTGGSSELVQENGMIIRGDLTAGLKKAIAQFIDHPELIAEMGAKSRKIAESMSWSKVVSAYHACYESYKSKSEIPSQ